MTTVVGVFASADRALEVLESMRGARLNTDHIKVVSGPEHIAEVASSAGAGADLAAGPIDAVVGGLVESELASSEMQAVRQRVEHGAALLLAEDLNEDAAKAVADYLRGHQAEDVIIEGRP
jgi:hypothetical protein